MQTFLVVVTDRTDGRVLETVKIRANNRQDAFNFAIGYFNAHVFDGLFATARIHIVVDELVKTVDAT